MLIGPFSAKWPNYIVIIFIKNINKSFKISLYFMPNLVKFRHRHHKYTGFPGKGRILWLVTTNKW